MLLIPQYAKSLTATPRMVFIRAERPVLIKKPKESEVVFDCKPKAIPSRKPMKFAISPPTNNISSLTTPVIKCYCFNCKETVTANIYEYLLSNGMWHGNVRSYLYECPKCKYRTDNDRILKLETNYAVARNVFVDDNKLKIKIKVQTFRYFNNRLFIMRDNHNATMNLDTGMTYLLPMTRNGKTTKKSRFLNNTYRFNMGAIDYYKYSSKCKTGNELCEIIFNEIRKYKMDKLNIYIPTFKEQHNLFLENKKNITHLKETVSLSDLALFNRFPTVNVFNNYQFFDEPRQGMRDSEEEKKRKKVISAVRKIVTPEVTNPNKALCHAYNIPFSKTTKHFFKHNIYICLWYKKFMEIGLKLDSINKLFSCLIDTNGPDAFTDRYVKELYKFFRCIKEHNTIQENSIVNKIYKNISEVKGRAYLLIDFMIMYVRTIKLLPTYTIDIKNNNFEELHDIIGKDFSKIRRMNKVLEYSETDITRFNRTCGELTFTLAKDTHKLLDVGSDMNICVGSYDRSALEKLSYIIIATDADNNYKICIELDRDYNVYQTKLSYNRRPQSGSMELNSLMEWIAINKLFIRTGDIPQLEKYEYYISNPSILENYPNKDKYFYEDLETCKTKYKKIIEATKTQLFVDSEAEVI